MTYQPTPKLAQNASGFTLVEMMIVVAVIGVLAAIAYPSYDRYVIKTKRTDMMTEMQNIASQIQSRKLAQGSFNAIDPTDLTGNYPRGQALYTVSLSTPLNAQWTITATPNSGTQVANDGTLTLNHQNIKCRNLSQTDRRCGQNSEWNE